MKKNIKPDTIKGLLNSHLKNDKFRSKRSFKCIFSRNRWK